MLNCNLFGSGHSQSQLHPTARSVNFVPKRTSFAFLCYALMNGEVSVPLQELLFWPIVVRRAE
jgi:hypothetical protein